MKSKKFSVGDIIYHPDLNKLLCCRDEYFNLCYNAYDFEKYLRNDHKRYYTVDNSGKFHSTNYKQINDFKRFKIIKIDTEINSTRHDPYPDCTFITCTLQNNSVFVVGFRLDIDCIAHSIKSNEIQKL